MPNKHTIKVSYEISKMLSKLWIDGDISSYQKERIMDIVRVELEGWVLINPKQL